MTITETWGALRGAFARYKILSWMPRDDQFSSVSPRLCGKTEYLKRRKKRRKERKRKECAGVLRWLREQRGNMERKSS